MTKVSKTFWKGCIWDLASVFAKRKIKLLLIVPTQTNYKRPRGPGESWQAVFIISYVGNVPIL